MLTTAHGFSGFSVRDPAEAVAFWRDRVGVEVEELGGGMSELVLPGGTRVLMYPKGEGHHPADYTILNFSVTDLARAIRELGEAGVEPIRYSGMPQDEDGGMRGNGPDIAWFADPSGNIFSVLVD